MLSYVQVRFLISRLAAFAANGSLAQLGEHPAHNRKVSGSSPERTTAV